MSCLQLHGSDKENMRQKYPSFELVLNFVKNDAISEEQADFLLKQRAQFARCTDFVYSYASDYLQAIGTLPIFEVLSTLPHDPVHCVHRWCVLYMV